MRGTVLESFEDGAGRVERLCLWRIASAIRRRRRRSEAPMATPMDAAAGKDDCGNEIVQLIVTREVSDNLQKKWSEESVSHALTEEEA